MFDSYLFHGGVQVYQPRSVTKVTPIPYDDRAEQKAKFERLALLFLSEEPSLRKDVIAKLFVRYWAIASGKTIPVNDDCLVWCRSGD